MRNIESLAESIESENQEEQVNVTELLLSVQEKMLEMYDILTQMNVQDETEVTEEITEDEEVAEEVVEEVTEDEAIVEDEEKGDE